MGKEEEVGERYGADVVVEGDWRVVVVVVEAVAAAAEEGGGRN